MVNLVIVHCTHAVNLTDSSSVTLSALMVALRGGVFSLTLSRVFSLNNVGDKVELPEIFSS